MEINGLYKAVSSFVSSIYEIERERKKMEINGLY